MCGIVGLWNTSAERPQAIVRDMLEALKHRGPDASGTLEFAGGAAGSVRLALVDLSPRGQQPLWSQDGRVAIVFNGEMYNFRAERDRLEAAGYHFRTTTDTEVVLNLYLENGLDFPDRMRGMYALAIFDWRKTAPGKLPIMVLVRGPLGIKHLYVAHPHGDPHGVIFSSEIRSLLTSGLVSPNVSTEALATYLAHGFVVQSDTILSGVRMLEPGTVELYVPGEPTRVKRYWRMPPYEPRRETLDAAADRLRDALNESVRLHALADAPLGAFLSGGVDSTGIVALMHKHVSDLRTYTVRFPDIPGEDEVTEAALTAKLFDCRHTVVDVTAAEVAECLPRFAGDLDQPSADGLNTWLMSRAASHDVKGVLSGVGGDEFFAGYPVTRRMARYSTTIRGRVQAMAGQIANLTTGWVPQGRLRERAENFATRRSALTTWLQGHTVFHYAVARSLAGLTADRNLQTAQFEAVLSRQCADWKQETPVGLSCLLDTRVFMIDQLLRDSDASSMAHSLELRVPFVDLKLAAFSRSCADEFKLRPDGGSSNEYYGSGSKRVLIHALRDLLPLSIANRQKKGFAFPYERWMCGELAPLVEETCSHETIKRRGLIDPSIVAPIRSQAQRGGAGTLYPGLWTLMIFELWCRAVLDKHQQPAVKSCAVEV